MKLEPEVWRNIRKIAVGSLVCTALTFAGLMIARQPFWPSLFGCLLGYAIAVGNFTVMAAGVSRALETGEERTAKRQMRISYILRTVVMLGLMVLAILSDRIHAVPVVLAAFYPRIVIFVDGLISTWRMRRDRRLHPEKYEEPEYEALPEDDGEEKEDGFEKFVGAFHRGPVPGRDDKDRKSRKRKEEVPEDRDDGQEKD